MPEAFAIEGTGRVFQPGWDAADILELAIREVEEEDLVIVAGTAGQDAKLSGGICAVDISHHEMLFIGCVQEDLLVELMITFAVDDQIGFIVVDFFFHPIAIEVHFH